MCRALLSAICCVAIVSSAYAADALLLETIIDRVQKNEQHFENIEAVLVERYRDFEPQPDSESLRIIQGRDGVVRHVGQRGMFRVECDESLNYANGKTSSEKRIRLFDGQKTRVFTAHSGHDDGTESVIVGRADDEKVVRPHMLLLRFTRFAFPLSTYLRGRKAIEAYPHNNFSDVGLDVTYRGASLHKGLRCHEIWLTHKLKESGEIHDRYILWLAEERNYIPVRQEGYTFRWSKDVPVSEAEVSEWREVKPGVWFPSRAEVSRFDSFAVQRERKMMLKWQQQYSLKSISFDRKFGLLYFRVLPKGKGA